MAIAEEIIGTHYRYHDRFVVGREKIREFAAALKDDHPAHRDEAEANELGYDGVLAPLTFIAVAGRRVQLEMFKRFDVGINIARVIHRDQKITFHRPLVAGDEVVATVRVEAVKSLGGNRMVRTNDNHTDRPSVEPGLQAGLSTQVTDHRNSRRSVMKRPRQLCFRHHLNKSCAQMR